MDLSSVRDSTGLFNWDLETGDLVEVDASGVDYAKVYREMGWLSGRASGSQFGLRLLAAFISLMLEEHVKTSQKSHSAKEDADMAVPESEAEDEDVKEAIEILTARIMRILAQKQIMTELLTSMMSAIYKLIAQKGSNISL